MKKYFNLLLGTLIACILFSCLNASAISGSLAFMSITLPSSSNNYYLSPTRTRTSTADPQKYYSGGTVDNFDGKYIDMKATICSVDSSGNVINIETITLGTNEEKSFNSSGGSIFEGKYKVKLSRKNSSLWSATHSGVWTY